MKINKSNEKISIDRINENKLLLFTTNNCQTCKNLIEQLKKIDSKEEIQEINAITNMDIAKEMSIIGTPCIIKLENQTEIDRIYGCPKTEKIMRFINEK